MLKRNFISVNTFRHFCTNDRATLAHLLHCKSWLTKELDDDDKDDDDD